MGNYNIQFTCQWNSELTKENGWGLDDFEVKATVTEDSSWHSTFLDMSALLGNKSHCVSKGVACFVTRDNRIISTGINGTPTGLTNCDDIFPKEGFNKKTHHDFSLRYEIHAEINALLSAARNGISTDRASIYVNYSPCRDCAKSIIAAGIENLYFKDFYFNDLDGVIFLLLSNSINVYQVVVKDSIEEAQHYGSEEAFLLWQNIVDKVDKTTPFWIRKK